jgi:hypothetical protein
MSTHIALVVIHVLLFAYWLGADWGVFVTSRYVANPELSLDERRRFLQAALRIDLLPKIAFTLLLPVGLQLATFYGVGAPVGPVMWVVWIAALAWLSLNVYVYRNAGSAHGERLRKVDQGIRFALAPTLIFLGIWSLATGSPVAPIFIAAKLVVFGAMIIAGLLLRSTMRTWAVGFQRLSKEGRSPNIDALFTDSLVKARWIAFSMWTLSGVMALLGVARFV